VKNSVEKNLLIIYLFCRIEKRSPVSHKINDEEIVKSNKVAARTDCNLVKHVILSIFIGSKPVNNLYS